MADNIIKLKVDSQEYEGKIKRASQGLQELGRNLREAGKTFADADAKQVEFARELGKMQTVSNTAKGKIAEMSAAFVNLKTTYLQMTDAEKQSPIGQAMSKSLEELKNRTIDAKRELEDLNKELNGVKAEGGGGGGLFSGDKISGMLQVFGGNLMTKAVGMAAGFATELGDAVKQGVELAKQGEGIRIAFERLGRGDILQGLREATHGTVTDLELMKAAVKFNDFKLPLDQLGTMLAFAQQKAKDTGQSVDYMVESITNGLGRQSKPILDNLGISAKEIEERMKSTGDFTKAVGEIIRDQMKAAGDYIETAADRAAQADVKLKNAMEDLGRTFQPLTDASNGLWNSIKVGALNALNTAVKPLIQALAEAGTLGQGARATAGFGNLGGNSKVDRMIGRLGNGKTAGAYSIYLQQLGEFDKYINNKRFQIAAYGGDNSSIAQSAKAKLQTELDGALKMREEYVKRAQELHNQVPSPFEPASTSGGGSGSGKSGSGKTFDISKVAFDTNKANLAGVQAEDTMPSLKSLFDQSQMDASADAWKNYKDVVTESIGDIGDSMNDITKWTKNFDPYKEKLREITERQKQLQMAQDMAAQAANNFGAALAAIDDPAAKAAGTVISAIANIALGFGQAVAQAGTMGPWAWLAYVAAGTAALATTISTVHSLTGYAEGGIVKGNSYSGDNMMFGGDGLYGLNAGELVLTKAQQGSLAQSLQNGGGQTVRVVGKLAGKDLFICAENWAKSAGKGEFVTW